MSANAALFVFAALLCLHAARSLSRSVTIDGESFLFFQASASRPTSDSAVDEKGHVVSKLALNKGVKNQLALNKGVKNQLALNKGVKNQLALNKGVKNQYYDQKFEASPDVVGYFGTVNDCMLTACVDYEAFAWDYYFDDGTCEVFFYEPYAVVAYGWMGDICYYQTRRLPDEKPIVFFPV